MKRSRSESPVRNLEENREPLPELYKTIIVEFGPEYKNPIVRGEAIEWKRWHNQAAEFLRAYNEEKYNKGRWSCTGLVCFFITQVYERDRGHAELQLLLDRWVTYWPLDSTGFSKKLERWLAPRYSEKLGNFGRILELHIYYRLPFAWRTDQKDQWMTKYVSMIRLEDVRNFVSLSFSTLPAFHGQFHYDPKRPYDEKKRAERFKEQARVAMLAIESLITENLHALAHQGFVPPKLNGVSVFDKYEKGDPEWESRNPYYEVIEGEIKVRSVPK